MMKRATIAAAAVIGMLVCGTQAQAATIAGGQRIVTSTFLCEDGRFDVTVNGVTDEGRCFAQGDEMLFQYDGALEAHVDFTLRSDAYRRYEIITRQMIERLDSMARGARDQAEEEAGRPDGSGRASSGSGKDDDGSVKECVDRTGSNSNEDYWNCVRDVVRRYNILDPNNTANAKSGANNTKRFDQVGGDAIGGGSAPDAPGGQAGTNHGGVTLRDGDGIVYAPASSSALQYAQFIARLLRAKASHGGANVVVNAGDREDDVGGQGSAPAWVTAVLEAVNGVGTVANFGPMGFTLIVK